MAMKSFRVTRAAPRRTAFWLIGATLLIGFPAGESQARQEWVGKAPACNASAKSCTDRGMVYVRQSKSGDGKSCVTGKKVLCRTFEIGRDDEITLWKGRAPACEAQPNDCPADFLYVKAGRSGDGARCTTGQKVQCRSRRLPASTTANWMSRAKASLGPKRLNEVLIPGTHNAGTAPVNDGSPISEDKADNDVMKAVPRPIVSTWARTQEYPTGGQLVRGARYLDFRICLEDDGEFYLCHGVRGRKLADAMRDIRRFLAQNPNEILLVHIPHFYLPTDDATGIAKAHAQITKEIVAGIGNKKLLIRNATQIPTFDEVWGGTGRVLVLHGARFRVPADYQPYFWSDSWIVDNYASAGSNSGWQEASELREAQEAGLRGERQCNGKSGADEKCSQRDPDKFWKVQGIITPDASFWAGSIIRSDPQSTVEVGQTLNGKILGWLQRDWRGLDVNVLMVDGYGGTELYEYVIQQHLDEAAKRDAPQKKKAEKAKEKPVPTPKKKAADKPQKKK